MTNVKNRYLIFLIIILSPLISLPLDIYAPSLPAISDAFQITPYWVKISLLAFWFGFGTGQPIVGIFIDRLRRKPMLLCCFILLLISAVMAALSHSIISLITMRLIQGACCAAIAAAVKAVMIDSYHGEELAKVTNYYSLGWSFTPIAAPFIGGYLQEYFGWQASFIFIALYSLLAICLCVFLLHETMHRYFKQSLPQWLANCKTIFSDSFFLVTLSFLIAESTVLALFYAVSPFLIQDVLGFSAIGYGHIMLLLGCCYLFGTIINRVCLQWLTARYLIGVGLIVSLIASVSMIALAPLKLSLAFLLAPMIVLFVADGLVFSNAMAECFSYFTKLSNVASSWMGGVLTLGGALVTLLVSSVASISMWPLAITYLLVFIVVVFLYFSVYVKSSRDV